jgi:predicted SnoaL-like aldol condensation-catalyzing enzyme
MDALIHALIAVQKKGAEGTIEGSTVDFKLIVRNVLTNQDLVAVHTQLSSSNPNKGGLRQVHLFRFSGDKIVEYWDITQQVQEYWDITQQVQENAPNAAGAFS